MRQNEKRRQIHQSNAKTDRIIENTKRQKITEIFEMLRPQGDQEGIISA